MKFFICLLGAAAVLNANPKNHSVVSGDANISHDGNLTEIRVSDRAILNWEEFSIQAGETTRFIQSSQTAAVLNRVTGSQMSEILGLLQAGGQVYLINPNGVVIGKEGRIDTAGFVSSVYEIQNIDFLNGEPIQFHGDELGEIINLGTITTTSGPVALIAHRVENSGTIHSAEGIVSLNSGHEILLDPTGQGLLFIRPDLKGDGVENNGTIEAYKTQLQADGTPTSLAISLGGVIDAGSVQNIGGEVYLIAKEGSIGVSGNILSGNDGQIVLHAENGTLDFQGNLTAPAAVVHLLGKKVLLQNEVEIDLSSPSRGGTLLVGGDYQGSNPDIPNAEHTFCGMGVYANVNTTSKGDGGKAIFWGDKSVSFHGQVNAEGGPEGGNGGFVEVSSPESFNFSGLVSTLAPKGAAGTLLLDPTDITINTVPTAGVMFVSPNYTSTGGPTGNILNTGLGSLEANLASGNVTINATGGLGANGDIIFDALLTWSANELRLISGQTVTLTSIAHLMISGTGSLVTDTVPFNFTMDAGSIIDYTSSVSPLTLTCGNDLTIDGTITTTTSSFSSDCPGFNDVGGSISSTSGGSITLTSSTLDVFITGTLTTVGAGTINLTPTALASQVHLQNGCTLNSDAALTINPPSYLNMGGTVTMSTPSSITLTSVAQFPNIRGADATLNATASSLSFPKGVNSGGPGLGLTVNMTNGDVFIASAVNLPHFEVNATGIIQIQAAIIDVVGPLTLNAGGNLIFDSNSNVQVETLISPMILQSPTNSIQLGDNVFIQGTGSVLLLAGQDITVTGSNGIIRTMNSDDLTLVVDNLNPNPPSFGTGKFTFPSGFTLSTGANSKVLLFAATPTINPRSSFPTTINGVAGDESNIFAPYWYITQPPPDPPLFQIMYKSGTSSVVVVVPPAIVETIQIAVTEPIANPPQITQITEGNLQPPATPNPKTACRTPPVAIQAL